jgi:hypothetical protein
MEAMTSDELKQQAAVTALNAMMRKGWLDICTVDRVAEMLDVKPEPEAYRILRPLHCVHFTDMPRDLYAQIPELIRRALCGLELFQFELRRAQPVPLLLGERKRPLLLRMLGRSS